METDRRAGAIDPIELQRRASRLFRSGDMAAAVPAYRRLLEVRPDLPNSWFNLAIALRKTGKAEDALAAYAAALSHQVDAPEEVHLQRGVIFIDDLHRPEDALAELDAALALNPAYLSAWLNLGNLHEDLGDWAAARGAYRSALVLAPNNALALARLAGVWDSETIENPVFDRLRTIASDRSCAAEDRADAGFALGAALDRVGDYDAAFAAYREANVASRDVAAVAGYRYDPDAHSAFIDRLIAGFARPVADEGETAVGTPLFICGMFRSGSTLAERILARHGDVVAGGELDVLPGLISKYLAPYPERVSMLSTAEAVALRDQYLARTKSLHPPGTILTDKRPDNFLHVGLIKTLFPRARIIHTVRSPRDTMLSVYFLHADPSLAYATDLRHIARYQTEQQRLMDHWRALYGDDIFVLDYDQLVLDPQSTIAALLEFCRLPWDPSVLDHQTLGGAVRTASHRQVRQPFYRQSSGRWRNYAAHLDIAADLL